MESSAQKEYISHLQKLKLHKAKLPCFHFCDPLLNKHIKWLIFLESWDPKESGIY